jgi:hypothetical protein
MFIPWVGLLEQVRLADIFVHYDDVQLPQGRSFCSRVQLKTAAGVRWLTAPIDRKKSGRLLNETLLLAGNQWRAKHLATIRHAYARAPHFDEMWALVSDIYACPGNVLSEFNIRATEALSAWFGLDAEFARSSSTGICGSSTARLVDLCRYFGAETYVTGLGALKYLDHESFERHGIRVEYMDYALLPYPQMYGPFTPYVSAIDPVANCGPRAKRLLRSGSVYWRDHHGE